jgi:hypothetical protein
MFGPVGFRARTFAGRLIAAGEEPGDFGFVAEVLSGSVPFQPFARRKPEPFAEGDAFPAGFVDETVAVVVGEYELDSGHDAAGSCWYARRGP